jgi:YVTN family beta-propeller protein
MTTANGDLFVLNAAGSVAEFNVATGRYLGMATGSTYRFNHPASITVADNHLFVTNSGSNSVTEINAVTRAFLRSLSSPGYGFSHPVGITSHGSTVWVANEAGSSVTELSAATGGLVRVVRNSNLAMPGPITYGDGYVFTASPPGSSPMVSQLVVSTAAVTWMMCNTNGPYLFNSPQAVVVAGPRLWVVNAGGNSLTLMNATTGALIRTVA